MLIPPKTKSFLSYFCCWNIFATGFSLLLQYGLGLFIHEECFLRWHWKLTALLQHRDSMYTYIYYVYHTCTCIFPQTAINCQQSIYEYQKATNMVTTFEMVDLILQYKNKNLNLPSSEARIRNDILIVLTTETRHSAKPLALEAVSQWLELATHFRCLRGVSKQHRHHCLPGKISSHTYFLISVWLLWIRWWIWAMEGVAARLSLWAGARACYRRKQHLPTSGIKAEGIISYT